MKLRKITHLIPFAILHLTGGTGLALANPPARECAAYYVQLAEKTAMKLEDRFALGQPAFHRAVGNARDWTKKYIMRWKKRDYPIMAMEDATPLKAKLAARHALGDAQGFAGSPFSPDELKTEITKLLDEVEAYPARFQAHLDDATRKMLRLEAMEDLERRGLPRTHNIESPMPVAKVNQGGRTADPTVEVQMMPGSWANDTKFQNELAALRKEVPRLVNRPILGTRDHDAFVVEHLENVKKLETYLGEFRDTANDVASRGLTTVDPEMKPLYDRIQALYQAGKPGLKDEFNAPRWAWENLRWRQFWAEMQTIYKKDYPKLRDHEQTQKVLDFLKTMDAKDLRALGIDRLADGLGFFGRNKYIRILGAFTLGGGGGLWATSKEAYELFWHDPRRKEECAQKKTDAQFNECLITFLQDKFTPEMIKAVIFDQDAFLDPEGKIKDAKVRAQVMDAVDRRKDYVGTQKKIAENQEALGKAFQEILAAEDPGSEAFREKLITAPRKDMFNIGVIGALSGDTKSYLDFNFPGQSQKHKAQIVKIFAEVEEEKQETLIQELDRAGAGLMAKEIRSLIRDRNDFQTGKYKKKRKPAPREDKEGEKKDEEEKSPFANQPKKTPVE